MKNRKSCDCNVNIFQKAVIDSFWSWKKFGDCSNLHKKFQILQPIKVDNEERLIFDSWSQSAKTSLNLFTN